MQRRGRGRVTLEFDFESKLDRRPDFIDELISDGEGLAERFLATGPRRIRSTRLATPNRSPIGPDDG